ncbi:type IV secretory system conjugative DNA transfer family protein [Amycolatopsis tolypomycina]|uniref:type IV secretory system conjugative DNA transfer family protein n=1 Tax=Amycolatopsis tolypomycina TaxID=208445 RepID=UPI00339E6DCD
MSFVLFPLFLACCGLAVLAVIVWARAWDAEQWRESLVAFQLHPSATLTTDDVAAWLAHIAAVTHPSRLALLPMPPVCVEVVGSSRGVRFYVLVARRAEAQLLAGLRATLPGCRITEAPDYLTQRPGFQMAAELTMTSHVRQLAVERVETASATLLAALQPVVGTSEIRLQWLFTGAGTPAPVRTPQASGHGELAWAWENALPQDAEAVQALRAKQRDSLLMAVARAGVAAPNKAEAYALFQRVWSNWHTLNAPGVRLRRRWLPESVVSERMTRRALPLLRWPLTVSAKEATGLLAMPVSGRNLPGVALGMARQLPPAPSVPTVGQVVALSNYPGLGDRPLALTAEDRTRHTYVVGPAGSGKSVLLTRLILNDIATGYGVFACDPKGDLINGVLERLDSTAAERVVVLDASKRDQPIGLNILGHADSEEARELVVDNVLHVFRDIWAAFWGPRTDQVLRAALMTLVNARAADGSALTICEVVPLLTNPAFRRFVTTQPTVPSYLKDYWQRFGALSENEVAQYVGPVLNKVEAFTQRVPIRLMLGQSEGIDLADILRERKVVLVNLAKGDLGTETGNLLGALVISELWKATLARVRVPVAQRRPCFAYIDEAQDIVRLPLPIADMLAQARGFKLGLTLANQYLSQLPEAVRAAVLGTVRTQIAFAVEYDDAKILERRFAPLTAADLSGLQAFELAMRPCVGAQTLAPVTGVSLPLPAPTTDGLAVARASRQRYGRPRGDVEAALVDRVASAVASTTGRRLRGGDV